MENSGEDLSSTASHSFSGDGGSASSEESGWTSYIDYFMETQQQQRRKEEVSRRAGDPSTDDAGAGRRCSSTSECSSDTGVGASTWLPLIELTRDSDATHHQTKVNSCDEISRSKRKSTGSDVNGANTTIDTSIKEDSAYDNNELMRKKGLCLVPMSAFHV
ncbi:unnamed protein product [Miscanthus lutarioriparius]|uniref:Uncharacterized protein n=1 Tax=Miscanthus lutarioriparius TaxID=422564 RepID=A0A811R8S9_9POAL|nr:unnamed protein product [Miscanthus lutarioriparius]